MLNYLISWINGGFISRDEHDRIVNQLIDMHNHDVATWSIERDSLKKKAADAARILQS